PGAIPGRVFVPSIGLEAQLMCGTVPLSSRVDGPTPVRVECLPSLVSAGVTLTSERHGDDSLLAVGVRFGDGERCRIDIPDGEHALIVGPARSGRSTALQRMVLAWRQTHPDGWWCAVAPRRTVLDEERR